MSARLETIELAIHEVIRGERPWSDLRLFGMIISPGTRTADHIPPLEVRATVHDLARGFMTYYPNQSALREWAFVMEALPTDFGMEEHPEGEVVMDALWKASFGEHLGDAEFELLSNLAGVEGKP